MSYNKIEAVIETYQVASDRLKTEREGYMVAN